MGYACPVCGHPQSDARHLANHLAFTALARGGDHEAWLDDRVPDWESLDETALGDRVVDHADPVEFPQVFEDTTSRGSAADQGHDHDHAVGSHDSTGESDETRDPRLDAARSRAAEGAFSDDAADALAEARELTRRRRENAARAADDSGERGDDGESGDDAGEGSDGSAESETE